MALALSSPLFGLLCEAPELGAPKGAQDVAVRPQGEVRLAAGSQVGPALHSVTKKILGKIIMHDPLK